MRFTRRTGIRTRGARAVRTPNVTAPAPNPIALFATKRITPMRAFIAVGRSALMHAAPCSFLRQTRIRKQ